MQPVEQFLKSNGTDFVLHEHPAVYTCEEAEKYYGDIPGLACKNLFLRNKGRNRYFLAILPANKKADLKKLSDVAGDKLTFASPEELKDKLGLEPGAVSPFGLVNNIDRTVEVYIDKEVSDADIVSFHPNRNTATLELTGEMFKKFLKTTNNKIAII